jgi:hypothetical protein
MSDVKLVDRKHVERAVKYYEMFRRITDYNDLKRWVKDGRLAPEDLKLIPKWVMDKIQTALNKNKPFEADETTETLFNQLYEQVKDAIEKGRKQLEKALNDKRDWVQTASPEQWYQRFRRATDDYRARMRGTLSRLRSSEDRKDDPRDYARTKTYNNSVEFRILRMSDGEFNTYRTKVLEQYVESEKNKIRDLIRHILNRFGDVQNITLQGGDVQNSGSTYQIAHTDGKTTELTIKCILAGGYNIQVLHNRWLYQYRQDGKMVVFKMPTTN